MTPRDFLRLSAASAIATSCPAAGATVPHSGTAAIPSTGERITRVGLGTWQTFDVGRDPDRRARLAAVLQALVAGGGSVVDTSPMYGTSPAVLGDLVAATGLRDRLWLATKVWTSGEAAGRAQAEEQFRLLRTDRLELLQVHNLVDWRTQLGTLRRWQEAGRIRYVGLTHYQRGAREELERIVRTERLDFVQYPRSLEEPAAASSLLGLCADRGVAFIANRPFGEGGALGRVRQVPLPPWAAELGLTSWAQYLLRWILAHPEVTCTIPGTSNPAHMAENLATTQVPPLGTADRARLAAHWRAL